MTTATSNKKYHDYFLAGITYGKGDAVLLSIRSPGDLEYAIILEDVAHFLGTDLLGGNIVDTVECFAISPETLADVVMAFREVGSAYYPDDTCSHMEANLRLLGKLFLSIDSSYGAAIRAIAGNIRETGPTVPATGPEQ